MSVPRFTWPVDRIPPGSQAHTGDGVWTKRCWDPSCDVTWTNADGAFPMFVRSHCEHGATHDGILIPGWNVGILA